jgi:hypothetical protein
MGYFHGWGVGFDCGSMDVGLRTPRSRARALGKHVLLEKRKKHVEILFGKPIPGTNEFQQLEGAYSWSRSLKAFAEKGKPFPVTRLWLENLNSTSAISPVSSLEMSVDVLYSTDPRRPLAFAMALVWWR